LQIQSTRRDFLENFLHFFRKFFKNKFFSQHTSKKKQKKIFNTLNTQAKSLNTQAKTTCQVHIFLILAPCLVAEKLVEDLVFLEARSEPGEE
jgi:hypothetical protein